MLFGSINDGILSNSELGLIVASTWNRQTEFFPKLRLDVSIVMPNHFHGLLWLEPGSEVDVSRIVRDFKSFATRSINESRQTPGKATFQRSFHDHVVRDEEGLYRIREYIITNPLRWHLDKENPTASGRDDFDIWIEASETAWANGLAQLDELIRRG